jgi:eukaryotic-like serine/threonine-protein kinase
MLGADGAALTDFGLARGLADSVLTAPGRVVGTLDYLAPEVIRGEPASPAADIYSLGCLLYECVCGSPPFGSRPFAEAAVAHLSEEPPDPCGLRTDLPLALWDALRHGLAKAPADRPPTATAYALMIRVSAKTS